MMGKKEYDYCWCGHQRQYHHGYCTYCFKQAQRQEKYKNSPYRDRIIPHLKYHDHRHEFAFPVDLSDNAVLNPELDIELQEARIGV